MNRIPDSPGYIILTSGSTASPKGVVRSHRAMVAGIGVWPRRDPNQSEHGVSQSQPHTFSGLRHFHKMIHCGDPITYVPIFEVVERPARWLRALSRTHASWAPMNNLLLDLCVRNVTADERTGLDLSHVNALLSSGEEFQPSAVDRFLEVYGSHGLLRGALLFGYAATEASAITISPIGSESVPLAFDRAALENGRVARATPGMPARITFPQGYPVSPQRVVIADPATRGHAGLTMNSARSGWRDPEWPMGTGTTRRHCCGLRSHSRGQRRGSVPAHR